MRSRTYDWVRYIDGAALDFLDYPVSPHAFVWNFDEAEGGWIRCVLLHDVGQGRFFPLYINHSHVHSPLDNVLAICACAWKKNAHVCIGVRSKGFNILQSIVPKLLACCLKASTLPTLFGTHGIREPGVLQPFEVIVEIEVGSPVLEPL